MSHPSIRENFEIRVAVLRHAIDAAESALAPHSPTDDAVDSVFAPIATAAARLRADVETACGVRP
jgi:hypothetical protein